MRRMTVLRALFAGALTAVMALAAGITAGAQEPPGPQPSAQQQGPETAPPPPAQPNGQPPAQANQKKPEYSIAVTSNLVNVDVVVTNQDGDVLTGLTKENFRVIDDGQAQVITNFTPSEAPLTIVMVMEYSARFFNVYAWTSVYWGSDFVNHLNKNDWLALVTYSMQTTVRCDFTQNKQEVLETMRTLGFPDFHEANEFDAILDTLDRLQDVKGKRAIVLLTSGADTFSKHTLDQVYKRLRQSDVPIFSVGTAEMEHITNDNIGYLQAKNELDTFGRMTGGYAWFPRFDGEIPGIFQSVAAFLRNQYTIGFVPSNAARDGKYHKLKIEVVEPDGTPFTTTNKKGKKQKVVVYAREGYTAPTGAAAD